MQTLQDNTSSIMRKAETHFSSNAQDFHKHTKLAIMTLMPTLYSHTFAVCFLFWPSDVSESEIRCQCYKRITFQGYRLHWSS